MGLALRDHHHYTYADSLTWPEYIRYALIDDQYGRPDIFELKGDTPIGVPPGVVIAWDALVARLPKPEY